METQATEIKKSNAKAKPRAQAVHNDEPTAEEMAEQDEMDTATVKAAGRVARQRMFFVNVFVPEMNATRMMEFAGKKAINDHFTANPTHVMATDFIVWGWKQPVRRVQTVKF